MFEVKVYSKGHLLSRDFKQLGSGVTHRQNLSGTILLAYWYGASVTKIEVK